MSLTRPALRYHGSKWRVAPWIIRHFPRHLVYVEPFGGGASVLLRKTPASQEVYNDLDNEIVNVFRVLRDAEMAALLQQQLLYTPHSRVEYDAAFTPVDCPVEAARRTIIKAFMGYSSAAVTGQYKSGFRGKRAGSTGPAHDWGNYPAHLHLFTQRLAKVTIECLPAAEILTLYDSPETLHYVDPPYMTETRNSNGYSCGHDWHADARHLWPEFYRLIAQCRPGVIFGEQVAGSDGHAWGDIVQATLELEDYAFGRVPSAACGFGAPQMRQRLYWVASANRTRHQGDGLQPLYRQRHHEWKIASTTGLCAAGGLGGLAYTFAYRNLRRQRHCN